MTEQIKSFWKDVVGYEGLYQVSNLGEVRKICKQGFKTLTQTMDCNGYRKVGLRKNKVGKSIFVHRLVAEAFIPNPNDYPQVNHKDENKENNTVSNLEWCTNKYNCNYGVIRPQKLRNSALKMWEEGRGHSRKICFNGKTLTMLEWAEELGISYTTLASRIEKYKWSVEKAFTTPIGKHNSRKTEEELSKNNSRIRYLTWNGETLSVAQWSRRTGMSTDMIYGRLHRGWSVEEIFSHPLRHRRKVG